MATILIIGASTGIGYQLSQQLAEANHHVFGTYNKTYVSSNYPNLKLHPLNVLDESLDFSFLPDLLDGVVYCPGSVNLKPFARIKPDDFVQDYQLQVIGAIKVLQQVMPKLKASTQSSIVLFSTVAVQCGYNFHSQVSASKGAIEGLTKALAAEFAPKIRVNCIAPSITDTPLVANLLNSEEKKEANAQRHPLKKIGTATDVANMAEFLLSDKATWLTGQVLHIDGGMSSLKV
jgi:NAD(P)-dependent dehydrogenase (short-subunit alcohol dehydrogenase family)